MGVAITGALPAADRRAGRFLSVRATARKASCVAVIGGGPAGAMLAYELARAGITVGLFAPANRPPLLVGESLVPAVVPFLQRLGIEEEVASFSVFKPGATFTLRGQDPLVFQFKEFKRIQSPYAYNCPRDKLDASILRAAERAGARVFPFMAKVERCGDDRVRLSAATLRETDGFFGDGPDWIIDATGRRRLLSHLLEARARAGLRRDAALRAPREGMPVLSPGHTHSDLLTHGWCCRIPLPGRTSRGFVAPVAALARHGSTPEEQYDRCLREDPHVRAFGG